MFCGKCGIENEEGFKFCKKCGADMGEAQNGISSDIDVFEPNEEDSQQDVENKLLAQEILNFIPLRENEEIISVTTSNSEAIKKYETLLMVFIFIFVVLNFFWLFALICCYYLFFPNIDLNIIIGFASMLSIVTVSLFLITAIPMDSYNKNHQFLMLTNQRFLGKSCGTTKKFNNNETLFSLDLSTNYTQTKSKFCRNIKYTINVEDQKITFYALNNLDEILSKAEEAKKYI